MTKPCRRRFELDALRDGRLEGRALALFEEHLSQCSHCREERRALDRMFQELRDSAPEDEIALRRGRERLLECAHEGPERAAPARHNGRAIWLSLAAIAVAALTIVGVRALRAPADGPPIASFTASGGAKWEHHRVHNVEEVELTDGVLSIDVRRSVSGRGVSVRVPDGHIDDLGTVFRVAVQGGHTTEITVREGSVVFHRPGVPPLLVTAGATWTRASAVVPTASTQGPALAAPVAPVVAPAAAPKPVRAPPSSALRHPEPARAQPSIADEDRAFLEIVALRRQNRTEEARVVAAEYLRRFPNGFRRPEVLAFTQH